MKETLKEREYASVPTEGKWFMVNPLDIDQNLFKEKRKDPSQERTRQYILEAFEEMKKNSKYAKPFKTMMPQKTWSCKSVRELRELATKLGDHSADWVEQAFEWAQRIANGESWEDICNRADTTKWYRLVVWQDKFARLIGGSCDISNPASAVRVLNYNGYSHIHNTVPLVVSYDV